MKNKGFTLVELLGVIVLIGLLTGLIIYKVRPSINDSKESVSLASANNLVSSLEDYYFEAKLKGNFTGCSYDFTNDTNTCTGFSFSGTKPSSGILSLSDEGVVSGEIYFDSYVYTINDNKIEGNN